MKITKSSLQVFKQVNPPPVHFVSVWKFVNSINFAQEMKILPLPSDFATYLFSTPTALCRVTVVGVQFFYFVKHASFLPRSQLK